jgi:transglutaminase-like putative cysteine protease
VLFSIAPCYRSDETPETVRYDVLEEQLVAANVNPLQTNPEARQYSVATTSIRNGRQSEIWPRRRHMGIIEDRAAAIEFKRLLQWDRAGFRETARLARQLLAEVGLQPTDRYQAAKALEEYFKRPGLFTYTLDPSGIPPRPDEVDPIEHFLLAHRRGHCEYFASALVMMLRSQGIPARVVVGYHGGDYNAVGKYYLVRQRDAHSWVEVFLEREHVPQELREELPGDAPGAWLRLDPTPEAEQAGETASTPLADTADFLEGVWNDYVLGLNSDRQRQAIYRPVVDRVRSISQKVQFTAQGLTDRAALRDMVRRLVAWVGVERSEAGFPWKTLLIALTLAATCVVLARLAWRTWRARGYGEQLARWFARHGWSGLRARRSEPSERGRAEFYRKFEKLLARRRFRRRAAQTQREFAAEVARSLHAEPLLRRVVETYYRVRFGGRPLDSEEAAEIEKALEELGQTLARRRA